MDCNRFPPRQSVDVNPPISHSKSSNTPYSVTNFRLFYPYFVTKLWYITPYFVTKTQLARSFIEF